MEKVIVGTPQATLLKKKNGERDSEGRTIILFCFWQISYFTICMFCLALFPYQFVHLAGGGEKKNPYKPAPKHFLQAMIPHKNLVVKSPHTIFRMASFNEHMKFLCLFGEIQIKLQSAQTVEGKKVGLYRCCW